MLFQQKSPLWRQILRQNFIKLTELADFLQLDESQRQRLLSTKQFPLNLPRRLAEKIVKGTLDDPIFKQFVPVVDESISSVGFSSDPVGESPCRKSDRLLQKYQGRVLLVCTSACAMHCRFCFRRHFDYAVGNKIFEQELGLIAADPSINEVILSGGDPLSLDNDVLQGLFDSLDNMSHIRKVRFHTRFPVGIPERIDEGFVKMLEKSSKQVWFVLHSNHAKELDEDVFTALKNIQKLGIPVLNQCVLLKGVNDTPEAMIELCMRLVDNGISPYYIHQLDRVDGSAHFEVDEDAGKRLVEVIAKHLPGYAVPRYVKEVAGMPNKVGI